jgi:hypothetical protein
MALCYVLNTSAIENTVEVDRQPTWSVDTDFLKR